MNKWNPARAEAIRKYVDAYFMERLFQESLTNGSPNETTNQRKEPKERENGITDFSVIP